MKFCLRIGAKEPRTELLVMTNQNQIAETHDGNDTVWANVCISNRVRTLISDPSH